MRGSQYGRHQSTHAPGIIPAGAGLTHRVKHVDSIARDHPRGCGAHPCSSGNSCQTSGSSPRVRGSQEPEILALLHLGIIPAGAELTERRSGRSHGGRDHPRGCGAHLTRQERENTPQGSSPRVRGSPRSEAHRAVQAGIIPAGAGLTGLLR